MEFLKGLQEAQSLGLTKDEFVSIWKIESQLAIQTQEEATRSNGNNTPTTKQDTYAVIGHSEHQEWQQLKENQQELASKVQHMCLQLVNQQEQQWKQMQTQHDQLLEEVRSRSDMLSDHIRNTVDCSTHALKLYIMQELGLLHQELAQTVRDLVINHECGCSHSQRSTDITNTAAAESSSSTSPQALASQQDIPRATCKEPVATSEQIKSLQPQNLAEISFDQGNKTNDENKINLYMPTRVERSDDVAENLHFPVLQKANDQEQPDVISIVDANESSYMSGPVMAVAGLNSETAQSITLGPMQAKKSYAEAIQRVKQPTPPSSLSSLSSAALSASCSSLNSTNENTTNLVHSILMLPDESQQFTVTLNELTRGFWSPILNFHRGLYKARLRGSFDTAGALSFSLFVKTEVDANYRQSVVLYGTGYIFHHSSLNYTSIWKLPPTVCKKQVSGPEKYVYKCEVCLETSRKKHPNVTYQQLVISKFLVDKCMTMKWSLQLVTLS